MAIIKPNNNTISAITALPAAISTGKVLQVVQGEYATEISVNTTSLTDTGLTASITPSSSSNKILIIVDGQGQTPANSGWGNAIVRGSTVIFQTNNYSNYDSQSTQNNMRATYHYLDSPSTTASTSYKLQVKAYIAGGAIVINDGDNKTTMTLMEIAGWL